MADQTYEELETYERPELTVHGTIAELTRSKPGVFFDFQHAAEGANFSSG